MERPKLTRPMQAAVVVALLVASILVWIGAPRRHTTIAPVTVDSVSITATDETKADTVTTSVKPAKKMKKKAVQHPPKSRDYLDERIN